MISLLFSALWGVIRRDRDLLKPEVSEQEINAMLVATTPNLGFYVGVIVLAIFAPRVAAFGYPGDRDRRRAARAWRPGNANPDRRSGVTAATWRIVAGGDDP